MKNFGLLLGSLFTSVTLVLADAKVGEPAPAFTAKDIFGKTHRLADFKGKIVVLEAYNYDCPFCANHFNSGAMQELQEEVTRQGGVWLVVNSVHTGHSSYRSAEEAQKEFKKLKMNATAWIDDSSGEIGKAYNLKTTPHMVVIDAKGVVVYEGAIDDKPAPDGDPRQARNYVRETIQALRNGQAVPVSRTKPYGCGIKFAD